MSVNFALALFLMLVVTGCVYLADLAVFRKRRLVRAQAAVAAFDAGEAHALRSTYGEAAVGERRQAVIDSVARMPWWIEYSVSFFPVILFVFVLRSFIAEPFRIPSGSMIPTLQVGDLILVNKYNYGIRLPVINLKVIDIGEPKRGDVMVFRYPVDPTLDYIKRVVGLPGDKVAYLNKRLTINGKEMPVAPKGDYFDSDKVAYSKLFVETLDGVSHKILNDDGKLPEVMFVDRFPHKDQCSYSERGVECTVPAGHYFMMGDNRDNSLDSRYWGFVPEKNIVGRAFFIWMNFSDLKRIGFVQHKSFD
jgi:signal peptidase I